MIQEFFEQIAKKEKGQCAFRSETIHLGNGARGEEMTCSLEFKYKDNLIRILYKLGVSNVATITCYFSSEIKIQRFEITTISHLLNLILRKKHRLVVKSKDSNFRYFIKDNKHFRELAIISNRVNFSPIIYSEESDSKIVRVH